MRATIPATAYHAYNILTECVLDRAAEHFRPQPKMDRLGPAAPGSAPRCLLCGIPFLEVEHLIRFGDLPEDDRLKKDQREYTFWGAYRFDDHELLLRRLPCLKSGNGNHQWKPPKPPPRRHRDVRAVDEDFGALIRAVIATGETS